MTICVFTLMNKTEALDKRPASESMAYNGCLKFVCGLCLFPINFVNRFYEYN